MGRQMNHPESPGVLIQQGDSGRFAGRGAVSTARVTRMCEHVPCCPPPSRRGVHGSRRCVAPGAGLAPALQRGDLLRRRWLRGCWLRTTRSYVSRHPGQHVSGHGQHAGGRGLRPPVVGRSLLRRSFSADCRRRHPGLSRVEATFGRGRAPSAERLAACADACEARSRQMLTIRDQTCGRAHRQPSVSRAVFPHVYIARLLGVYMAAFWASPETIRL
jgi:hypothetical protein